MVTAPAASSEVASDHPCVRCGYSLRGLRTTGKCPECSTPVERSLLGDRLVFSDPEYVQTLRRGSWLVFVGLLALLTTPLLMRFGKQLASGSQYVVDGVTLFASALFLWGWWWVTRPDAGQLATNRGERPRQRTHLAVVLLVFTKIGMLVLPHIVSLDDAVQLLIRMLDRMALCLGVAAGMQYIMWLAPRLPSDVVLKQATRLLKVLQFVAWMIVVCYLALLIEKLGKGIAPDGLAATILRLVVKLSRFVVGWTAAYCFITLSILFNHIRKELARISKAQRGPAPAVSGGAEAVEQESAG